MGVQTLCLTILFSLLVPFTAIADAKSLQDPLGKWIVLKEFNGLTVSDFCVKNGKANCEALEFSKKKYKKDMSGTDSKTLSMANPASVYCKLLAGESVTLKDSKGDAYAYCQFKDSSLIDAWSLYRSHFSTD